LILVTGGAGFIGANFVHDWLAATGEPILNLDKLTYAGNPENLASLQGDGRHLFVQGDIATAPLVGRLLLNTSRARSSTLPRSPMWTAPSTARKTSSRPTSSARSTCSKKPAATGTTCRKRTRPGSASSTSPPTRSTARSARTTRVYRKYPVRSNSPYSASKASSDHLVRAYHHTYGLPVLTTNCSNNYGPYQFPEKLIPLMILNATGAKPLPIYGDGMNVRDWLYVADHCSAIRAVLEQGRVGETYNVGGWNEMPNLDIVHTVCGLLDEMLPSADGPYKRLIHLCQRPPGHDRRYAIDASKIHRELGWKPAETFATGIRKTVKWYLDNMGWVENVASGEYRKWIDSNYGERGAASGER